MVTEDVRWKRTLTVTLYHEGTPIGADVKKRDGQIIIIIEGKVYEFRTAVIEAIYDLHQDIPR